MRRIWVPEYFARSGSNLFASDAEQDPNLVGYFNLTNEVGRPYSSVAEPPLFWAAPEVLGPGADSGFDQIWSAPAPGKKRRLQAAPASYSNIFHFEFLKIELLMQVFFGSQLQL